MAQNRRFYGQMPSYGPNYRPNFGPNWYPLNEQQMWPRMWPRMWSPNDDYFRPQGFVGTNDHSASCCLSTANQYGCQSVTKVCKECPQICADSEDNGLSDGELNGWKEEQIYLSLVLALKCQTTKAIENEDKLLKAMDQTIKDKSRQLNENHPILEEFIKISDQILMIRIKNKDLKKSIGTQFDRQRDQLMSGETAELDLSVIGDTNTDEMIKLFTQLMSTFIDKQIIKEDDNPTEQPLQIDDINSGTDDNKEINEFIDLSKKVSIAGKDLHQTIELPFIDTEVAINQTVEDLIMSNNGDGVGVMAPIIIDGPEVAANESDVSVNLISLDSKSSQDSNDILTTRSVESTSNLTAIQSKPKLNPQKQKILKKLSAILPEMSDEVLTDWIFKTRDMFNQFGNNGFSGMSFRNIVDAIYQNILLEDKSVAPKQPTVPLNESQSALNKCGVCLETIGRRDSGSQMVLSCGHTFHLDCLQNWAQTNNRCPKCKEQF